MSMVVHSSNYHEIASFVRLAEDLECKATFSLCRTSGHQGQDMVFERIDTKLWAAVLRVMDEAVAAFPKAAASLRAARCALLGIQSGSAV